MLRARRHARVRPGEGGARDVTSPPALRCGIFSDVRRSKTCSLRPWERTDNVIMPIRSGASSGRARGRHGPRVAVITTTALRPSSRSAFSPSCSFLAAIRRHTVRFTRPPFSQMAFITPTAETFRQFLNRRTPSFSSPYVGAAIRQRSAGNALQTVIGPLTQANTCWGRWLFYILRWSRGGHRAHSVQVSFASGFVPQKQSVSIPAITLLSFVEPRWCRRPCWLSLAFE